MNKFKQLDFNARTQIGGWNALVDTYVAEILAGAGFDWVLIDAEHAPFDLPTIVHQLQAMAAFGVPVLVRPPKGDSVIIKQLLDAGVQTLVVPMVETAEQAAYLYQAMQYPPKGIRGVGTAMARAAQWNRTNDYFKTADENMCLIVQVESVKGIESLDAILAVEGVEGVFIGPADLAASMGQLGNPNHPTVKAAIETTLKKIRAANKIAGIMATAKPTADLYIAQGANMVAVAIDTLMLVKATQDVVAAYKQGMITESNTKY
ncbi:MAG: hypothetical protein RLZZ292_3288 [Bacteroidota bacterium]|jgi:4-hydroxy-2-oxoheptanedioate aldolase